MKKLLNNVGMTLIEVVAATIILGVIAAPLLNVMLEIMKTNIRSDVELRMNVQVQKAIEEIKARGSIPEIYSNPIYFDKRFKEVDASSKLRRYEVTVSEITSNSINTDENYDRWDFEIRIDKPNESASPPLVKIYNNAGVMYNDSGEVYNKKYIDGKLFVREENLLSTNISNLELEFIGELGATVEDKNYRLIYNGNQVDFIPGYGSVQVPKGENEAIENSLKNNPLNNYICVNVIKGDTDSAFNLNVTNSTYYDKHGTSEVKQVTLGGLVQYKKAIMINVFNDDDNKIIINNSKAKPYVYVNKVNTKDSKIVNGHKFSIIIKELNNLNNENHKDDVIVKEVSTIVGEDVK